MLEVAVHHGRVARPRRCGQSHDGGSTGHHFPAQGCEQLLAVALHVPGTRPEVARNGERYFPHRRRGTRALEIRVQSHSAVVTEQPGRLAVDRQDVRHAVVVQHGGPVVPGGIEVGAQGTGVVFVVQVLSLTVSGPVVVAQDLGQCRGNTPYRPVVGRVEVEHRLTADIPLAPARAQVRSVDLSRLSRTERLCLPPLRRGAALNCLKPQRHVAPDERHQRVLGSAVRDEAALRRETQNVTGLVVGSHQNEADRSQGQRKRHGMLAAAVENDCDRVRSQDRMERRSAQRRPHALKPLRGDLPGFVRRADPPVRWRQTQRGQQDQPCYDFDPVTSHNGNPRWGRFRWGRFRVESTWP